MINPRQRQPRGVGTAYLVIGLVAAACSTRGSTQDGADTGGSPQAGAAATSGAAAGAGRGGAAGAPAGAPAAGVPGSAGSPTPVAGAGSETAGSAGSAGAAGAAQPDAGPATDGGQPADASAEPPGDAGASDAAAGPDAGPGPDRCDVGVHDGSTPRALSLSGNTFAHDPTMIEANGVFYRFWTGDNIPMATSTDLMSWRNGPAVYRGGYPAWSREWLAQVPGQTFNFPWAPDVSYFGGRYHLYSSFSAKFGDNISCITHLTTTDLASGQWTDHGPVICTQGNERYNAIDADVELDEDGTPYLAFGSFWDGIMAFELDSDGERVGSELTRLAWAREIEAPVLLRRCGYYYLFVTWGLCCPGEGRSVDQLTYRVAVGRSRNILGPYVDKAGVPLLEGGGTLLVQGDGTFAAAGHSDVLVTRDRIYHLYHAYRRPRGGAELRIVELPFDAEGWPVAAAGP